MVHLVSVDCGGGIIQCSFLFSGDYLLETMSAASPLLEYCVVVELQWKCASQLPR